MDRMSRWALALSTAAAIGCLAGAIAPAGAAQGVPEAVKRARTTELAPCTIYVDAAARGGGSGTKAKPFRKIAAAAAAVSPGGVICVAEGVYAEELRPGEKHFRLAGGYQSGTAFSVRDSAAFVSRAQGEGRGSFLRIEDPGPSGDRLTAIDGFEITGYSQAVVRDVYYSQRFDLTNNHIHDNVCADGAAAGAGFSFNNVSGLVARNVFARNACGRGGAGATNDSTNENGLRIENNLFEDNSGTEQQIAHGGALYLFANTLKITGNSFIENRATGWGGGLYVGAFTGGGQTTWAELLWNVYRDNRAGIRGGGLFCDDSARCLSKHEIYDGNCGGNIYLDGGPDGSGPTIARFDHLTNHRARAVGCAEPGAGVVITKNNDAADRYSFTNAIFFRNGQRRDFEASCDSGCDALRVTVSYSMVRKVSSGSGVPIEYGPGIVKPENPLFVAPARGDFHLQSNYGHWTKKFGYAPDLGHSPALAKGDPASPTNHAPPRAGDRVELGAYGDSAQASYVE